MFRKCFLKFPSPLSNGTFPDCYSYRKFPTLEVESKLRTNVLCELPSGFKRRVEEWSYSQEFDLWILWERCGCYSQFHHLSAVLPWKYSRIPTPTLLVFLDCKFFGPQLLLTNTQTNSTGWDSQPIWGIPFDSAKKGHMKEAHIWQPPIFLVGCELCSPSPDQQKALYIVLWIQKSRNNWKHHSVNAIVPNKPVSSLPETTSRIGMVGYLAKVMAKVQMAHTFVPTVALWKRQAELHRTHKGRRGGWGADCWEPRLLSLSGENGWLTNSGALSSTDIS